MNAPHDNHAARGRMRPGAPALWIALACVLGLASAAVHGQHFGRNKVLWENFDFEVLETEHFRIHYYPENSPSADYVARIAERWYARLSGFFDHDFEEKKPLIIYQDHADFQQTTTTPGLIGEATGGFTESRQNRIVLPLTGINADNNHVIGHELVHAFQYDMAQQARSAARGDGDDNGNDAGNDNGDGEGDGDDNGDGEDEPRQPRQPREQQRQSVQRLPLWVVEGLAEYLSQGRQDPHTALYMRDAVFHETLPDTDAFVQRRPSPYQYGQAVWAYVGGEWGDDTVRRLYKEAARIGPGQALEEVLGLEQQAFFEQFHEDVRSAYEPVLDGRQAPESVSEPLLTSETTDAQVNLAPSISPDGRWIAFLSTRELAMELYLADAQTGEVERKLVSAQTDPHFDNLSFLDSSVAWSPDSTRFAFGVFARGDRRLAIYNLERGRVERRLDLPDIDGMRHPTWSPDGERIVFSAVVEGASDLYEIELETGDVTRLTNDPYTAIQPAFSPSGDRVAFVTDRAPATNLELLDFADHRIAMLDMGTREIEVLPLFEQGKHIDPHFSPDGDSLYFIAEAEGAPDLYRYDFDAAQSARLVALKTGVSGVTATSPAISVAADTGRVAFTVLEDGAYNVYSHAPGEGTPVDSTVTDATAGRLPPEPRADARRIVDSYLSRPELGLPPESEVFASHDYESDIGLTSIGPATIGVGRSEMGSFGGGSFSAYFSDTLSRHRISTTFRGGSSGGVLDFSDTLGGQVTYLNQANRLQWGASASRMPYLSSRAAVTQGVVDVDGEEVPADIVQRLYQVVTNQRVSMVGRYPLSINNRFEFGVGISRIDFDQTLERTVFPAGRAPFRDTQDLQSPPALDLRNTSAAFVRDTSQFGFVSPLRGMRFRAEAEFTTGDIDYRTTLIDFRKYWLNRPVTLALRAMHLGRRGDGADDQRLAPLDIGQGSLVRGYGFDSFNVSECTRTAGSTACPELDRLVGTRIGALNFELRLPLFGNEQYGLFEFPAAPTELFFFVDAGAAWTSNDSVEFTFERDTTERVPVVSSGIGARTLVLGQLPLELYYAYPYQRPEAGSEFGFRIRAGW